MVNHHGKTKHKFGIIFLVYFFPGILHSGKPTYSNGKCENGDIPLLYVNYMLLVTYQRVSQSEYIHYLVVGGDLAPKFPGAAGCGTRSSDGRSSPR